MADRDRGRGRQGPAPPLTRGRPKAPCVQRVLLVRGERFHQRGELPTREGEPREIVGLCAPRSTLSGIDGNVHCRASPNSPVLREFGGYCFPIIGNNARLKLLAIRTGAPR